MSNCCTSSITDMTKMFEGADSFNRDIGDWDVISVSICNSFHWPKDLWILPKPNLSCCWWKC
jgi:hypothetical protein